MDAGMVNLLRDAGLADKEAQVYLALLEAGQATASRIADSTKLKRPTVYVTLESLAKKGYASKMPNKKIETWSAGDPAVLSAQLSTTAKHLLEMLPYLQSLQKRTGKHPKITYYDTEQAVWNIYKEQGFISDVCLITSWSRLRDLFPRQAEEWFKNGERGIFPLKNWRHIVTNDPEDVKIGERLAAIGQQVRSVPGSDAHAVDLAIYGNKFSVTLIEKEPFIVVIESEQLARSLRGIFEIVWRTGKKVTA